MVFFKLNILKRRVLILKDFLSCLPRHSFISDEVNGEKDFLKWLYIAPLKLSVCQITNPETEFLIVRFKTFPFRPFIFLAENKEPRDKF